VAPAKVDTVKIVKGEKVKVPNKDWSINEKTEAAAKLQQAPASVPVPTTAEKTVSAKAAPAGTWQVQLMSSQNKKATENAWNTLVKKYPPLQGQPHEIETADLDFDGVFYRLKAGAFADRSGADNLCRDIKALGGTCIVKKK
jgi:cell division septation protein DedD